MKKRLVFILLIMALFALPVNALETEEVYAGYGTMIQVSDVGGYCFIKNEFYSIFADELFESQFNEYQSNYERWLILSDGDIEFYNMYSNQVGQKKVKRSYVDAVKNGNGIWYSTVIFNYTEDFSSEKNLRLAQELYDGIEILYVGKTTPCVVVGLKGGTDDIYTVIDNSNVSLVLAAFESYDMIDMTTDEYFVKFNPQAADARKILRYSAKIENLPEQRSKAKEFLITSDSDFDGKITSVDARIALRIAAGLERGRCYGGGESSIWNC